MKTTFMSVFATGLIWCAMLALVVFGTLTSVSVAVAQQTQASFSEGHAICGALDLRTGKLLPPCSFDKAEYTGKAVGKCPTGSFFDLGTWSCFTCPSGYNRTGFAVDTPKACSKEIRPEYKYAKRVAGHKACPAGSFKDGRNGGECWSCPTGYSRTMSALTAWDACGKVFASARKAEFIDRVCLEGSFPDPNGGCYICPTGFSRTAAAVTGHNACFRNESQVAAKKEAALTCKEGDLFDFIDGGTCWKCPANSVRSLFGVKSDKACEYTDMLWEPAKRAPNGLFRIPGGHEIAAQVIKERTRIDGAIKKFLSIDTNTAQEREEFAKGAWELIQTEPENSPILMAAVYDHVFDLVINGPKTDPERDIVRSLGNYVQGSRMLVAEEMSRVWESWNRGIEMNTRRLSGSNMVSAYNTGVRPPNMQTTLQDIMTLSPGALVGTMLYGATRALHTSITVAKVAKTVMRQIFPYAKDFAKLASISLSTSASTAAGIVAAPFAFLTVATIIASIATDIAADQDKQGAIVKDAMEIAKRPVILSRLLLTEEGRTEVSSNWALMTQEQFKPRPLVWHKLMSSTPTSEPTSIQELVLAQGQQNMPNLDNFSIDIEGVTTHPNSSALTAASSTWTKVPGKAQDVAIGSDGTTYAIGTPKGRGGFRMFKRAKNATSWTKIKGAAVRIAVAGTQPWVVTDDGQIFSQAGSGWKKVAGPAAQDIGASVSGVWIIDLKGKIHKRSGNGWQNIPGTAYRVDIDQDGRPWVVDLKGQIFVHNDKQKWVKLPGSAIDVAADVPGMTRVIGKDGKTYVYNTTKRNWDRISEEAESTAIGAGGGEVWRLTKQYGLYRLQ